MTDHLPFSKAALTPKAGYASDIITITSLTGVGSSTTLKELQNKLGMPWRFVSGGAIMREFARELGMTIEEFAAHNRAHPEDGWDRRCDLDLSQYGRQNFTVIESRLAHVCVPHAFHVLLVCDLMMRAMRRRNDTPGASLNLIRERINARDENDDRRYERLYPGSVWVPEEFDCVLNTGELTPGGACVRILSEHIQWQRRYGGALRRVVLLDAPSPFSQ